MPEHKKNLTKKRKAKVTSSPSVRKNFPLFLVTILVIAAAYLLTTRVNFTALKYELGQKIGLKSVEKIPVGYVSYPTLTPTPFPFPDLSIKTENIKEGFKKYTNETLGFSFLYPSNCGLTNYGEKNRSEDIYTFELHCEEGFYSLYVTQPLSLGDQERETKSYKSEDYIQYSVESPLISSKPINVNGTTGFEQSFHQFTDQNENRNCVNEKIRYIIHNNRYYTWHIFGITCSTMKKVPDIFSAMEYF